LRKILLAVVLSLTVSACQKASDIVIDNTAIVNPQLTYFSGDSVDIARYINNHSLQLQMSDSFRIVVSDPSAFSYIDVNVTNDSGSTIASDRFSAISDSTVGGVIYFVPQSVYVGDLTYTFTPYNQVGAAGNSISSIVRLYNSQNHPPVVDSVTAPDSVQVQDSSAILFTIYATASDPDGINDLKTVYFDTYKPDGSPSKGNPFPMYDDGGASGNPADADSAPRRHLYADHPAAGTGIDSASCTREIRFQILR